MKKRYSHLIVPLQVITDILIINLVVYLVNDRNYLNINFLGYTNVFWIVSSLLTGFYKVYRFTKVFRLLTLLLVQFSIFTLGFFTYFSLFKEGIVVHNQTVILSTIILCISFSKLITFFALKKYRAQGKNYRNVVIIGFDSTAKKIVKLFKSKKDLGYNYKGFFSNKHNNLKERIGNINDSYSFLIENNIDELYCSLTELTKEDVKKFTKLASEHNKVIKLIPDANDLYNKTLSTEYYDDSMLVLNVKKLPFEYPENHLIKRSFDVFFSLLVSVLVLSWLTPIIWILIKLESKGSAFFKQPREGVNGKQFICYKFRSMKPNANSNKEHVTKNDDRVTKIGAFIRKTSIDELPQFINVLKGDMSVVGPRPHMQSLSQEYQKDVDDYLRRHAVKPGITGLAQVSGYRGEIKKKSDIKNRIRLDIFYIENWSFFLDIKIIFQTIFNVFKGEEKAY